MLILYATMGLVQFANALPFLLALQRNWVAKNEQTEHTEWAATNKQTEQTEHRKNSAVG